MTVEILIHVGSNPRLLICNRKEIYVTKRYKEPLDSIDTNDVKYIPSSMIKGGLQNIELNLLQQYDF